MPEITECSTENRIWLLGTNLEKDETVLYRPDCKMWDCPHCANVKAKQWAYRIRLAVQRHNTDIDDADHYHFLTFTIQESSGKLDRQVFIFREAWEKFRLRLYRACPHQLSYVLIPELSPKTQRLHAHGLINWDFMRDRQPHSRNTGEGKIETFWYSKFLHDHLKASGLGYIYDIVPVETPEQASSYVSKYIGKGLSEIFPPGFRRVRTTQNFPEVPKEESMDDFIWEVLTDNTAGANILYKALSIEHRILDLSTKLPVNTQHPLIKKLFL